MSNERLTWPDVQQIHPETASYDELYEAKKYIADKLRMGFFSSIGAIEAATVHKQIENEISIREMQLERGSREITNSRIKDVLTNWSAEIGACACRRACALIESDDQAWEYYINEWQSTTPE